MKLHWKYSMTSKREYSLEMLLHWKYSMTSKWENSFGRMLMLVAV
jgi:hypothetical protein